MTTPITYAVTIPQPRASLIALGSLFHIAKSYDTALRGPLVIVAAAQLTADDIATCKSEPYRTALIAAGITSSRKLPLSAAICLVEITDSQRDPFSGGFAWHTKLIRRFITPIPTTPLPGVWKWHGGLV